MKQSKLLSLLTSLLLTVFWLTLAVAVPLLCRPYYFLMVRLLHLESSSGFSRETIHEAYHQLMDYLVFRAPFGTGDLRWSEEGMAHFADCRLLFQADFLLLKLSALLLMLLVLALLKDKLHLHHFYGNNPAFWAAAAVSLLLVLLGIWALLDFWSLFTFMHAVFFPGKDNWLFSPSADQIILILPEAFWAVTGTLVLLTAVGGLWFCAHLWHHLEDE